MISLSHTLDAEEDVHLDTELFYYEKKGYLDWHQTSTTAGQYGVLTVAIKAVFNSELVPPYMEKVVHLLSFCLASLHIHDRPTENMPSWLPWGYWNVNLDESSTDKTDTNWKEELLPKGKKKKKSDLQNSHCKQV